MAQEYIIAHADKCVLRITGLEVKGMNTAQLEETLEKKIGSMVRVIGVTGESVEMDVYGIDPEVIQRDEDGIIKAVATTEGINLTDLAKVASNKKIVEVDYDSIKPRAKDSCAKERWVTQHE